jgi:hypothetical protein
MAPEYALRGQLTQKADVFGFGVLVLETISGRKNRILAQEELLIEGVCLLISSFKWKFLKISIAFMNPCIHERLLTKVL